MVFFTYNFFQPLEQFSTHCVNILSTNYSYVIFLLSFIICFYSFLYIYFLEYKISGIFLFLNNLIKFILNIFFQQIINLHILIYFPLVLSICLIILFSNLYGLFPYGFTITSHI